MTAIKYILKMILKLAALPVKSCRLLPLQFMLLVVPHPKVTCGLEELFHVLK